MSGIFGEGKGEEPKWSQRAQTIACGLIGASGWLSDAAQETRQRIESLTDDLAAPAYDSLTPQPARPAHRRPPAHLRGAAGGQLAVDAQAYSHIPGIPSISSKQDNLGLSSEAVQ